MRWTKKPEEIEIIAEGGKLLAEILQKTAALVKPGVSTFELTQFAEKEIIASGGKPSFIDYGDDDNPFPCGLCTSVNDVVVHGIPNDRMILKGGDIIGLDIGMVYKGLFTDTAITVPVGSISPVAQKLIDVTRKSLNEAIKAIRPGARMGDVGWATQKTVEQNGFSVVRDLVGHGVGYEVHEDPMVPNYGRPGTGIELVENMVLAIEPMVCQFKPKVTIDRDGWTIRTADGGLSAHFEHTIAVTKRGARILT